MSLLKLSFLALIASTRTLPTDDVLDSRFSYEYHVIDKLVELTNGLEQMTKLYEQRDELIVQLKQDLKEVKENSKQIQGGSVFVRWGRSVCPGNGTELVYRGFAGGSHFTHGGGAANYLCLPEDPTWAEYSDATSGTGALLYGAEYQFVKRGNANLDRSFPSLLDHDVSCVVCRSMRLTMVMIPARVNCYDSWAFDYGGYLAAGHYSHAGASEFVCLDKTPEKDEGGRANDDGKLFHLTEGRCGSLKCPPYVNGREIACVVCTK